ncbi:MAG: cryptochrome/photolyase family protein [Methylocystis sp.]|nr:MAG: cryptochrome/photolyase family protein [Methylocystis sp.]
MPKALRFILGDQLSRSIATLDGLAPGDVVLMAEVADETRYVRHHKQKIVLVLSAMRHFAAELREEGIAVDYIRLDDPESTGSFSGELARAVARYRPKRVVVTEPGEWRVREMMLGWEAALGLPVEIRDDDRFFCSRAEFARWAEGRNGLRMEFFYREMRRRTGFLMEDDAPVGGKWNFDPENRKALPAKFRAPDRLRFSPDAVTTEVMALIEARFPHHFGDRAPFGWGVTREEALAALDAFIADCLPSFGDYQDAMKTGAPFLHHATLSPYLNLGLLTAHEVCVAAERAWRAGAAPINAVEGFIRQILGWREFVRGVYWLKMPDYAETNALHAMRPLPCFYWSGETRMNCLRQVIGETKAHAYAHHIQRLMVTGNFALLAGVAPREIEEWYLVVYADAYEWVELPNVHGMAIFADGGLLASKPYAASGAYIDRMSDYCKSCAYDVKAKTGPKACPFNYLYWNFFMENRERLPITPRLAMPLKTLDAMSAERRHEIRRDAAAFLGGPEMDARPRAGYSEEQGRLPL